MWGFGPSRQVPLCSSVFLLIPQAQPELRSAGSARIPRSSARLTATQSPHVNQLSGMHRGSGSIQSLPPGEVGFVSSALVFRLISSWLRSALLSCSRQRLAALQLASFLATPGWAGPGWEHLLGTVWVAFVSVFVKSRSWRNPSLLFSRTLTPPPPCIFQMHFWKRACSENWQIIVQWPGGNARCSSFIMQILRSLQKCGKLKMMAVVRTSLQKVVVLLHRLQRMAVSSPRYQKLCKVTDWK